MVRNSTDRRLAPAKITDFSQPGDYFGNAYKGLEFKKQLPSISLLVAEDLSFCVGISKITM